MSKCPSERWNAYWSKSTLDMMDALAAERGITRKELVVVAVSLMQALAPAAAAHEVAEALERAMVLPFVD